MSYAKATIIGYVGSDTQTRQAGETTVTSFTIAANEKVAGQDKTTWFRVNGWGKVGDTVAQHVKKGTQLYVEGRLSQSEYTDKEGNAKTSLEVRLENFQFLGSKNDAAETEKPKAKAASAGAGTDSSDNIPF